MARQRALVAALAISLAMIACKDKKQEATSGGGTGTATAKGDKVQPAEKPALATGDKDDLSLIPVDAEAVIGVNWVQLQQSPLWKQFVEPEMMKDADFQAFVKDFKDRCGFDPMTSVKKMTVGLKKLGDDTPEGVMVMHGPDKAKTLACLENDKWRAEAAKEKVTIKREGEIVTLVGEDNASAGITFIGDNRVLVVVGTGVTPDAVTAAAKASSTLSTSPSFVDMHGKIAKHADKQSLWFLMNGNSKIFEEASALGLRPKAVFGSLSVTDGMSADVRARLDSPDQATQTVSAMKGQLASMSSMFDKLELTSDGADVKLEAAASKDKLQNLLKLATGGGM